MMQNELEKFIHANRESFDDEEPSNRVWNNLDKQFGNNTAKVVSINRTLFFNIGSVAAAIIIVSVGAWLMLGKKEENTNGTAIAAQQPLAPDTSTKSIPEIIAKAPTVDTFKTAQVIKDSGAETPDNNGYSEELFYYTKLTEIKFKQLKKIEKEEPVLYQNFYAEIKKLDSTYQSLQALLATNADKETVLTAMLTNLKMQTEVLNKQLSIIKTIKQSKKKHYEKDFKSV